MSILSALLAIIFPTVSLSKCTVIVLALAKGTIRIVVVRLVFGLNEAVLLVLAATAELPITHEVELPPCFTYTPVHPLMVLLVKPVTLMLIVSLHSFCLNVTGRL